MTWIKSVLGIAKKSAKTGVIVVQCCTQPSKQYEMLAKFQDGRAIVGAKRKGPDFSGSRSNAKTSEILSGTMEYTNGVDTSCLYCNNNVMFTCSCGHRSCDTWDKTHTCPQCGKVTNPDQKRALEVTHAVAGMGRRQRTLAGKQQASLPKNASKRLS